MKGGYVGIIGTAIGVVIGDTRSLDYGSFRVTRTYRVPLKAPLKADRAMGGGSPSTRYAFVGLLLQCGSLYDFPPFLGAQYFRTIPP